jgi:hypothetical protein
MRKGTSCECPDNWVTDTNDSTGIKCVEEAAPEGVDLEYESQPSDKKPALTLDVPVTPTNDGYEVGFGFYYRYMFRLPGKVDLDLARKNWLGIAGLSENGDFGTFENAGDRCLSVF